MGEKKYRPIAVTARKIGEVEGEDILKLNIPKDDANSLGIREDNDNKDKIRGDDEMSESEIEAKVDKRIAENIGKMKLQETIDRIRDSNKGIEEKVDKIEKFDVGLDSKLSEMRELYGKGIEEIEHMRKSQEEECVGVNCIKDDIKSLGELKKTSENINEEVHKLYDVLSQEYAVCEGNKGCNSDVKVGSSYCPNCGKRISKWENHPDWVPYWKREGVKS